MRKPIKAYLITDPFLYPKTPLEFRNFYQKILSNHKIDFAAYRDKTNLYDCALMEIFLEINHKFGVISLLNSNIELALDLGFDGVHCNSRQLDRIKECKKQFDYVFFSAHSLQDLQDSDRLGANGITIGPIFKTPNKGAPLGIDFLKQIAIKDYQAEIFALGGIIEQREVDMLSQTQIQNFASIRYFL